MNKPNTTAKKKAAETIKIDSFSIDKTKVFESGTITFDMTLNGVKIYGCFVHEGKNGDFISLPQRKGSDGKYYSIVWARFSEEDEEAILKEVERVLNS